MNEGQKQLEMQLLQQHLQQLQEQFSTVRSQILQVSEMRNNLDSLKSIKNQKTIVPIGAGLFLESNTESVKEVLMNVGANVIVRKDLESAKEILDKQVKDLEKIALKMEENLNQGILQLQASQIQ